MLYRRCKLLCDGSVIKATGCISAALKQISPKLHTSDCPRMCWNQCLLGCNRSVVKRTSLEEQRNFSFLISASIRGISFIPPTFHACTPKSLILVAFGLYIRPLCLENKVPFRMYLGFHWKNFLENWYLHFPRKSYKLHNLGCDGSIIKGT